jgi:hypothetical protein
MRLQVELPHSFREFRPKLVGHDSGQKWVATSHSCDSFIHYSSPV